MASSTIVLQIATDDPHAAASGLYRDGLKDKPTVEMPKVSDIGLPSFENPYQEREYKKKRLALAFRIFAKYGFEDGVSGHITLRVRFLSLRGASEPMKTAQLS